MKCKYCDYENPEGAIVCECCGATLATQRSVEFYKRQAKKKPRRNPRRVKPPKEARSSSGVDKKGAVEASASAEEKKLRFSRRAIIIIASVFLAAALLICGALVAYRVYHAPVLSYSYSKYAVALYDPEAKSYLFLVDGKLVPGSVESEAEYTMIGSTGGITVFSSVDSAGGVSYIAVSKDGINELDIAGATGTPSPGISKIYVTEDGEYLIMLVTVGSPTGLASSVYGYGISDGGEVFHIADGVTSLYVTKGSDILCVSDLPDKGCSVISYDCASGWDGKTVIYEDSVIKLQSLHYYDDEMLLYYSEPVDGGSIEHVYDAAIGEEILVTDMYYYGISIYGNYISYYKYDGSKATAYIFSRESRESFFVGDEISVHSVNEDASVIYACDFSYPMVDSFNSSLYVTNLEADVALLTELCGDYCFTKDGNDVLFTVYDAAYLSEKGAAAFPIKGECHLIYPRSACEESFIGGIFDVTLKDGNNVLCKLNDSYELEVLSANPTSLRGMKTRSDDKKTVFFVSGDSGCIYSCREGSSDARLIGASFNNSVQISSDGRSFYSFSSPGICEWYSGGKGKLIEENAYSVTPLGDGCVIMKQDGGESLINPNENMFNEDGSPIIYTSTYTYSLYYSKNGSEKRLVMKNVATYKVVGDALYVFVLNENAVPGKTPIYDVYAGIGAGNLKPVARGVELR